MLRELQECCILTLLVGKLELKKTVVMISRKSLVYYAEALLIDVDRFMVKHFIVKIAVYNQFMDGKTGGKESYRNCYNNNN